MSYVISVGGDPINPNPYYYSQVSLTASQTFIWPSTNQSSDYVATNWVDITADNTGYVVTLPAANEAATGAEIVFNNYGSNTITVNDASGGNITTVASGITKRLWITDNTTSAGIWRIANIGSGTTSADASMLAGYGLIAQAGQLSQSMQVATFGTSATINAGYRSYMVTWTGGSGTFTLGNPVTLGNNWFVIVKNAGSGTLTIDGNGANIDGSATTTAAVNEGFIITTDGVKFYTTGRITPNTSGYTFLSKSVTGSTDITLSASEAVFNIIEFTGTLGASINVVTPTAVNEWIMHNSSTGSTYTLTVKTSGGTGKTLSQGVTRILYCDGTNVRFADDLGSGTVTSVATGTGLTGGPITTSGTISLANTAVTAGSYNAPYLTVDSQGRLTLATNATTLTTPVTAGSTLTLQAYDTDGTSYTTFATLTANTTPTMDLNTAVTINNSYIYRIGGTDVSVADGGTGASALTANNVILGNGTSAVQFVAPGTSGNVLTSNGTVWQSTPVATLTSSSIMEFSSINTGIGSGVTAFLGIGNSNSSESAVDVRIPFSGTLQNFYASASNVPGAGQTYTYTVSVNGGLTSITSQTSGGSSRQSQDTTHTASVSAGDLISIKTVVSGSGATSSHRATFEVVKS